MKSAMCSETARASGWSHRRDTETLDYLAELIRKPLQPRLASSAKPTTKRMKKSPPRRAIIKRPLSEREIEVGGYVAEGRTVPEISFKMQLSPNTVRQHCRRITAKTGAIGRVEIATFFIRNTLRMSGGEKRKAVEIALAKFPDESQKEIARRVGCNQSTVQRVKKDVMHAHNVPNVRKDSAGRNQPTRKPHIVASIELTKAATRDTPQNALLVERQIIL